MDAFVDPETIDTVLPYRYGVVVPSGPFAPSGDFEVRTVETILGVHSAREQIPLVYEDVLRGVLYELSNDSPLSLNSVDVLLGGLGLSTFREDDYSVGKCPGGFYTLDTKLPADYDVKWYLLFDGLLPVLEVIRRGWGPTKVDIARQLVLRGIPLCCADPTDSSPALPALKKIPRVVSEVGYRPSLQDYLSYEKRRDDFLRDVRGPLALRAGGIVWRLAIEALGVEDVLLDVMEVSGARLDIACGDRHLVSDTLTEQELDLICGVYKILNSTYIAILSLRASVIHASVIDNT